MFFQLPPAGNRVAIGRVGTTLEKIAQPYRVSYYGSGTSALAAAMVAAQRLKRIRNPEVILPGYGCPDLVSAAVYASLRPVLVDLDIARPWMDLSDLNRKLSERTVAIVAVHLLGIPERVRELRDAANQVGSVLIEDRAQAFPMSALRPRDQGDYIILSFGRGKPVSVLGGGAVLSRDASYEELLPTAGPSPAPQVGSWLQFYAEIVAYNLMRHPRLYWLPARLPGLKLGETSYHALEEIARISPPHHRAIAKNMAAYLNLDGRAQNILAAALRNLDDRVLDLPRACCGNELPRLLRYPLLIAEPILYRRLRRALSRSGLGVSTMYGRPLNEIEGVGRWTGQDWRLPAASAFAAALITLPTHQSVAPVYLRQMISIIDKVLSTSD